MYTEFAYSTQMQIILAAVVFIQQFIFIYFIADIILRVYKEHAESVRIAVYACLSGAVLHSVWVYGAYFLMGAKDFHPLLYLLITTPNPAFAVLYYIAGVKALKFSKVRSFSFMGKVYLFHMLTKSINRLIKSIYLTWFPADPGPYNYLQDAIIQLVCLGVFLLMYWTLRLMLKAGLLRATHAYYNVFSNLKREWVLYLLKCTFVYAAYIIIPYLTGDNYENSVLIVIMALFYAFMVFFEYNRALAIDLSNRDAHIKTLAASLEEADGVRHDLRNILNTYGGYIELGMLDGLRAYHARTVEKLLPMDTRELSGKLEENPALVALLEAKIAYAISMGVKLRFNINCHLGEFYIDNLDLCRIIGNLTDNAIEAAAESERTIVGLTFEAKGEDDKLIVVMNSTKGPVDIDRILIQGETTKEGHSGIGLPNVRRIVAQYGNCAFRVTYYDGEFVAYLELRKV